MTERLVAYHEAGHAVAAFYLGLRVREVSIVPDADGLGYVFWKPMPSSFRPDVEVTPKVRDRIEREAIATLAGPCAEEKAGGNDAWRTSGSDLEDSVALLGYLCTSDDELQAYLNLVCIRARNLVERLWHSIDSLAHELLAKRRLSGEEVRRLIARTFGAAAESQ